LKIKDFMAGEFLNPSNPEALKMRQILDRIDSKDTVNRKERVALRDYLMLMILITKHR
jgi:hypothetical protein